MAEVWGNWHSVAQEHWGYSSWWHFLGPGSVRLGSTRVCDGWFSSATRGYWKHLGFCRSILDACVVPILLYECESWLMTHTLMEKVESFQEELAKTVLKWPKHHCNTAALECRQ